MWDPAALIAQWIATIIVALGLTYTIRNNNKNNKTKDIELKTVLKTELENIEKMLDDPSDGLKAIKKAVDEQKLYCIKTSTGLTERVISLEAEGGKERPSSR